jgi:hypothetical protein
VFFKLPLFALLVGVFAFIFGVALVALAALVGIEPAARLAQSRLLKFRV